MASTRRLAAASSAARTAGVVASDSAARPVANDCLMRTPLKALKLVVISAALVFSLVLIRMSAYTDRTSWAGSGTGTKVASERRKPNNRLGDMFCSPADKSSPKVVLVTNNSGSLAALVVVAVVRGGVPRAAKIAALPVAKVCLIVWP